MGKQAGLYVIGDVPQPSNYTRIPNIAIEQLEVYAFKLLAILMDVARTTSKVWQTNKNLAKQLGCSVNRMKKARTELEDKGYILVDIGTETTRAHVTVLFTDIWKMNADHYEELNPKPQKGVSPYDTPLSWDDNPLSQDDTLTKQDNITIQEKKTTTPLPPARETKKAVQEKAKEPTELKAMKQAVRQLKAYGDVGDRVAKTLLNLHDDDDKNVGGEAFKPDDVPQFIAWWQDKYPDLTIPRNSQSCVKWFNIWRDERQPAKPKVQEAIQLGEVLTDQQELYKQIMALPVAQHDRAG